MDDLSVLREYIRGVLLQAKKMQKKQFLQERLEQNRLRKQIRKLIREAEDVVTHESTGINVLADLLETIIPILKSFYKKLGTDIQQRKSFRSHIVKSVENMLRPIAMMFKAGGHAGNPITVGKEQPEEELEEKINVNVETPESDPSFIPLKADRKEKEEAEKEKEDSVEPKPEDAFVEIEGEDETGRNIALQAFKRVEKQIREAYSILANEEDRELFYKYLITNLKLYFDKFEDELQTMVKEPTTPEYEEEKNKKDAAEQPEEAVPPTATEEPIETT